MALCLRCDNTTCSKVITELDDELSSWWTLERFGSNFLSDGRHHEAHTPVIEMHSILIDGSRGFGEDVDIDELDEDDLEDLAFEQFIQESDAGPAVTLHFCTAKCLSDWSSHAAAFED